VSGLRKAAFFVVFQSLTVQRFLRLNIGESSEVIKGVDYSGLEEKIKYAAKSCPVEVIKYEET
jgi:ferredoxin